MHLNLMKETKLMEDNFKRFYEVPVGATFRWGNVHRYKKIKDVHQDDIYQDEMEPNCIDLNTGHKCVLSAIFKCYDIEE